MPRDLVLGVQPGPEQQRVVRAQCHRHAVIEQSGQRHVTGPGGPSLAASPDAVAAANPITSITADAPPFVIFHGDNDLIISPSQTLMLHNALVAAGVDSTRYVVHGAGHGDLAFLGDLEAGLPWTTQEVFGKLVDFVDSTLA